MHWAIEAGSQTEYVCKDDAETAEIAEHYWRQSKKLFFITVKVRPTTPEEDKKLQSAQKR